VMDLAALISSQNWRFFIAIYAPNTQQGLEGVRFGPMSNSRCDTCTCHNNNAESILSTALAFSLSPQLGEQITGGPGSLIKSNLRAFFFTALFMVLGPSEPPCFWGIYFLAIPSFFIWALYLVYIYETHTGYKISLLGTVIEAFAFLACNGAYVAVSGFFAKASVTALATRPLVMWKVF
jgi:hypothetical protein